MTDENQKMPRPWYERDADPLEILLRDVQKIVSEHGYILDELHVRSVRRLADGGAFGKHVMYPSKP